MNAALMSSAEQAATSIPSDVRGLLWFILIEMEVHHTGATTTYRRFWTEGRVVPRAGRSAAGLTGVSFSDRLWGEQEAVLLDEGVMEAVHLSIHCCLWRTQCKSHLDMELTGPFFSITVPRDRRLSSYCTALQVWSEWRSALVLILLVGCCDVTRRRLTSSSLSRCGYLPEICCLNVRHDRFALWALCTVH